MRTFVLAIAISSTACAEEPAAREVPVTDQTQARAEAPISNGLADPPPAPAAPPHFPGLMPLEEASIAAELGSGASCTLIDRGRPLMVAMMGNAVINDGGRIVHLKPQAKSWNELVEGGRFVGPEVAIEVDPGQVMARHEEVLDRDASVHFLRGRHGFSVSDGPLWSCGS